MTATPPDSPRKKKHPVFVDTSNCRYDIVRQCATALGWEMIEEGRDDWTVFWIDTSVAPERLMRMKPYQKINHIPGMNGIARKIPLSRNLNRMQKVFGKDYDFFPSTWCLPQDASMFKRNKIADGKTFIIKPSSGCQGRGIVITKNKEDVNKYNDCVVQVYLDRPFLIDGFKFDLRVYALVVSVDPLRIFMYNDGLVRLCTEPYMMPTNKNMNIPCMHLTNYSLNKHSDKFEASDNFSVGAKRNFAFFNEFLRKGSHNVQNVWNSVADVIIKTIISYQPWLKRTYRSCMASELNNDYMCFEILGFDIFFDDRLKPWLLEVNHSPSFNTDTLLDRVVKRELIAETMQLLCVNPKDRNISKKREKALAKERITGVASEILSKHSFKNREEELERRMKIEKKVIKNYKLIYPLEGNEKYDEMIELAATHMQKTDIRPQAHNPLQQPTIEPSKVVPLPSGAQKKKGNENKVPSVVQHKITKKILVTHEEKDGEDRQDTFSHLMKPFIVESEIQEMLPHKARARILRNPQQIFRERRDEKLKNAKTVPFLTLNIPEMNGEFQSIDQQIPTTNNTFIRKRGQHDLVGKPIYIRINGVRAIS